MKNKKQKEVSPQAKTLKHATQYMVENARLQEKYGIMSRLVIIFPRHKKVPFFSKIAMRILRVQGGKLDTRFEMLMKK